MMNLFGGAKVTISTYIAVLHICDMCAWLPWMMSEICVSCTLTVMCVVSHLTSLSIVVFMSPNKPACRASGPGLTGVGNVVSSFSSFCVCFLIVVLKRDFKKGIFVTKILCLLLSFAVGNLYFIFVLLFSNFVMKFLSFEHLMVYLFLVYILSTVACSVLSGKVLFYFHWLIIVMKIFWTACPP